MKRILSSLDRGDRVFDFPLKADIQIEIVISKKSTTVKSIGYMYSGKIAKLVPSKAKMVKLSSRVTKPISVDAAISGLPMAFNTLPSMVSIENRGYKNTTTNSWFFKSGSCIKKTNTKSIMEIASEFLNINLEER